jgi:hypothetical protein
VLANGNFWKEKREGKKGIFPQQENHWGAMYNTAVMAR